ncbi:MAG: exonuclease domain-containing protein [Pseudoclavibacter sp.]|nr:exonuclease domain-containing protein [Pseudoclavibacter sp.]
MPLDFTAIDFETANGSPASACAVGLVRVRDGREAESRRLLLRPPAGHDEFRPVNVALHGIGPVDVLAAPAWPEALPELLDAIGEDVLVAHNARFDLGVLAASCLAHGLRPPTVRAFCTLRAARAVYRLRRHRLPEAARAAGFTGLRHHDPVSDARAAAAIVTDAARRSGADSLTALALALRVPVERWFAEPDPAACEDLIRSATLA